MRLYLVRHGQTAWNIQGKAQGHTDIPLDPTGLDQAARLGSSFANHRLDRILSSDLGRAVQTAEPVSSATGAPIEPRPDLRERAFGQWEGMNFLELNARFVERVESLGKARNLIRPPGGESFEDVWLRLDAVVADILADDGNVMVVTHGGTSSLLLAKLLHGTLETSWSFRFSNAGVTTLQRRENGFFQLERFNDASHLSAPALTGSLDGTHR